jgi:hypothetical protein
MGLCVNVASFFHLAQGTKVSRLVTDWVASYRLKSQIAQGSVRFGLGGSYRILRHARRLNPRAFGRDFGSSQPFLAEFRLLGSARNDTLVAKDVRGKN